MKVIALVGGSPTDQADVAELVLAKTSLATAGVFMFLYCDCKPSLEQMRTHAQLLDVWHIGSEELAPDLVPFVNFTITSEQLARDFVAAVTSGLQHFYSRAQALTATH